jgi:hypothetical protein
VSARTSAGVYATDELAGDQRGLALLPNARFDTDSKITRLDAYWDNTVLNSIKASGV